MMTSLPMMTLLSSVVLPLLPAVVPLLLEEALALEEVEVVATSDLLVMLDSLDCSHSSRMSLRSLSIVLPLAARRDPDMLKFAAAL